jgi:hypothetical protein
MQDERRNYRRFKVNERAFAGFIRPESDDIFQLGQIIDISKGGFCSFFIPTKKIEVVVSYVSIFGQTDTFLKVEKIPCKIVYDKKIPWSELREIRCGIEFLSQYSGQESQIEDFIRAITVNLDKKSLR